jgi:hypothetical protein
VGRVVVYPATATDGVRCAGARARGAAGGLVVKASGVGVFDELLEAAVLELRRRRTPSSSGTSTPRRRSTGARDPATRSARCVPRYDLVLTYGGGEPVVARYRALGARGCVPIYNALDPDTHHPVAPDPRFAPTSASSATGCRTARRASRSSSSPRAALPAGVPAGRQRLGRQAAAAERPLPRPRLHARPQRLQLHAARGAQHQPRQHGALRLLAGDARVRGGRRAACLITDAWEGIELFLEPAARCSWRATAPRWPSTSRRSTPRAARAIGEAARRRVLAEHTYAHRAAQLEALLAGRRAPRGGGRDVSAPRIVVLGLSITSSWGNGHATTYRGLVRELARAATTCCSSSATCPGTPRTATCRSRPFGRTELYARWTTCAAASAGAVRDADVVIVGSYVPEGVAVGDWVTATARGVTAFYDIDTPVTLAKLARGDATTSRRR